VQYRLPGESMTHVITIEQDVWRKRSGGGWLVLAVGLPFLLLGLGVLLWGCGAITVAGGAGPPPWGVTLGFGGVLTAGGLVLVFGRAGVTIDRRAGTVVRWWGLFGPMCHRTSETGDYDHVVMSEAWRATRHEPGFSVYPIRLAGERDSVLIAQPRDETAARRVARDLAHFLEARLTDETGENGNVRD